MRAVQRFSSVLEHPGRHRRRGIELSDAPEVVDAFTTIGNSGAGRVDSSYDGGPVVRRPGHLLDTGPRVSAAQRARLRSGVRRSRRCP